MKQEKNIFIADDGKLIVRKNDNFIMGDIICMGVRDTIENYEERDFDAETIAKYKPAPKEKRKPLAKPKRKEKK